MMHTVPMQRRGTTDDIAKAALFFLSDLSEYVTGQTLAVDGGYTVGRPARLRRVDGADAAGRHDGTRRRNVTTSRRRRPTYRLGRSRARASQVALCGPHRDHDGRRRVKERAWDHCTG